MTTKSDLQDARVEAEECVISSSFLAPQMVNEISTYLTRKDFLDESLGETWELMVDLTSSKIDPDARMITVEMKKRGVLDRIGGMVSLARIMQRAPNAAHFEYYAREVVRYSDLRRIGDAGHLLSMQTSEIGADPQKLLHSFVAKTEGVGNSREASFVHMKDVVASVIKKKRADSTREVRSDYFSTGFPSLDAIIGGFAPTKLYLLGARTGVGKTALAANFTIAAVAQERAAWFCSLEMKNEEVAERMISSYLSLNHRRWRGKMSEQELQTLEEFKQDVADKTRLWMTDVKESFHSIRAKCRLRKSLEGIDLLVVDNLQLVKAFNYKDPKHERIKQLTEAFKELAKEMNIAVVVLAQLSVDSEKAGGRAGVMEEPGNNDWADSKRIIDDADVGLLIHRASRETNNAKLVISKHRGGPLGAVPLNWAGEFQVFSDANVDGLE